MKKLLLNIFTLCFVLNAYTQAPDVAWQNNFGGSASDYANAVLQTSDNGFFVIGQTPSNNIDVSGNHSSSDDAWLIKLDNSGNLLWQKCFGGTGSEQGHSIISTNDGNYVFAGSASSNNNDVSGGNGSNDFWVVKFNATGTILWQKCFGGTSYEWAYGVKQASDNGYFVVGATGSINNNVSGNYGGFTDGWVIKLNENGELLWQKCVGGTGTDALRDVQTTADGGCIVVGYTNSVDNNAVGNHGNNDVLVVKLNSSGTVEWSKCFGSTSADVGQKIISTNDGNYIFVGTAGSNNNDVSGSNGGQDIWVVKINTSGNIIWQKCLGSSYSDIGRSIAKTSDGNYVLTGEVNGNNGDVSGANANGYADIWIVKINDLGNLLWQKCVGGINTDSSSAIQQAADGGYIIAGTTFATDNVTTNGLYDYFVFKLESDALSNAEFSSTVTYYPNPTNHTVFFDTELNNIEIYDNIGRKIKSIKEAVNSINISNLQKGNYFLKGKTPNDLIVSLKIIKN